MDSTPDKDGEDDISDPATNPCHYDRNLQIFSFVSLFLLVVIAIAILANSGQSKGISKLYIIGTKYIQVKKLKKYKFLDPKSPALV